MDFGLNVIDQLQPTLRDGFVRGEELVQLDRGGRIVASNPELDRQLECPAQQPHDVMLPTCASRRRSDATRSAFRMSGSRALATVILSVSRDFQRNLPSTRNRA